MCGPYVYVRIHEKKKQEKRRAKGNESESKLFSPIHKCVGLYQASRSFGLVRSISRLPVPKETNRGRRKDGINKKRKKDLHVPIHLLRFQAQYGHVGSWGRRESLNAPQ